MTERRIAAFCLTAKEHDDDPSDDLPPNYFELTDSSFVFNRFHGEPIDPGEAFLFHVQLRYMDDPGVALAGGGVPRVCSRVAAAQSRGCGECLWLVSLTQFFIV